jgi:hypothetical protein
LGGRLGGHFSNIKVFKGQGVVNQNGQKKKKRKKRKKRIKEEGISSSHVQRLKKGVIVSSKDHIDAL